MEIVVVELGIVRYHRIEVPDRATFTLEEALQQEGIARSPGTIVVPLAGINPVMVAQLSEGGTFAVCPNPTGLSENHTCTDIGTHAIR